VSRFGDDGQYRVESAKLLATFAYLLQGTPYIYQGEEIGTTNVAFDSTGCGKGRRRQIRRARRKRGKEQTLKYRGLLSIAPLGLPSGAKATPKKLSGGV
jgi:glycosidase